MPDPLVDVIAQAIVAAHDEQMRRVLTGELAANVWEPRAYAEIVVAAVRSRLLADDVVEAAASGIANLCMAEPQEVDDVDRAEARAALAAALDQAEGTTP